MMYARTMSWISRKVSPTFLFLTSTILGVSYSKRKEDTFSMHFCPMAVPGLCRSLLPALLLAVPWAGPCPPPLVQLLCLQTGGKKKETGKKNDKNAIGVALCTSGLSGFLLCAGTVFPLPISSGLGAVGALHGPGVGRVREGARPPRCRAHVPWGHAPSPRQGPSMGTEGLWEGLRASRDHEASLGSMSGWRRWRGSRERILGTGIGV